MGLGKRSYGDLEEMFGGEMFRREIFGGRHPSATAFSRTVLAGCFVLGLSAGLAACGPKAKMTPISGPASEDGQVTPSFGQFSDVPIPTDSEMDLERTFILGKQENWIGRLVISSGHSAMEIFDFFRNEMPKFDWKEIAVVRSEVSILTYSRGNRIASLQIQSNTLIGSMVNMVITPQEDAGDATPPMP